MKITIHWRSRLRRSVTYEQVDTISSFLGFLLIALREGEDNSPPPEGAMHKRMMLVPPGDVQSMEFEREPRDLELMKDKQEKGEMFPWLK